MLKPMVARVAKVTVLLALGALCLGILFPGAGHDHLHDAGLDCAVCHFSAVEIDGEGPDLRPEALVAAVELPPAIEPIAQERRGHAAPRAPPAVR